MIHRDDFVKKVFRSSSIREISWGKDLSNVDPRDPSEPVGIEQFAKLGKKKKIKKKNRKKSVRRKERSKKTNERNGVKRAKETKSQGIKGRLRRRSVEREKVDQAKNVREDEDEIASAIQRTYKTKGEPDRGVRTFASRLRVEIKRTGCTAQPIAMAQRDRQIDCINEVR